MRRPAGRVYVTPGKMEPGLVTLTKIVGVLIIAIGLIPLVFLMWPSGDRSEPKFDPKDEADAHH